MDGNEHTLQSPCIFWTPKKVEGEWVGKVLGAVTCIIH